MRRRGFLHLVGGVLPGVAAATAPVPATAEGPRQRVIIIGGAWAGLSAARELRQRSPDLDVLVIDREPILRSLPLSNTWLVDRTPERMPRLDRAALAGQVGYRFLAAEVLQVNRTQRRVHTSQGALEYDWLLIATGLSYDYGAWFGGDLQAARVARENFPAGFVADELDRLKQGLAGFGGGTLVMTIPASPYRCPPAPYERAMMLAWWLKTRHIKGKLIVLDAGGGLSRFTRLFADRYPDHIEHRPYSVIRSVDPHGRRVLTDDDDLHFDHALLLPPMGAGPLVERAGLLDRDKQGQTVPWASVDPVRLCSPLDERVYLAGDLVGSVSPLFGHYPKTAHMAVRLGAIAAQQIAARSARAPELPVQLPHSTCHVWLDAEPPEQLRMEVQYRMRGDGVITQAVTQHDNPQPRDEDLQWGMGLYTGAFGATLK